MSSIVQAWPGIIRHYAQFLPVDASTPVVTLLEGNTPLIPAPGFVAAIGGTARIGPALTVSASVGLPIVSGASYDAGGRRYAAIEAVKVYVPAGVTVEWGAHQ